MKNILFVTQKSNNAIGIVDNSIRNELGRLEHNFTFLNLREKGYNKYEIIKNYIINIIILIFKSFGYNKIYFSWENPYVIFIKLFYPWKKNYMCIMHVEDYWGKTIIGKMIFKSVEKYFVISQFTKNQLLEYGIKSKDIFINYLGINKEYFPEKINNFQNFEYILYVGTELERKNIHNLLLSFKKIINEFPNLKLIKIGKSVERQRNTDELVKRLGLENNIVFIREFISNNKLRKYYSNAICYISVSYLEGFGMTIPEALSCGCPVVVSNIGPFKEIVGCSQLIVDPNNVKEISNGIIKYKKNKKFRNKMSYEGINIAKKFNWESNAKYLIKYFTQ